MKKTILIIALVVTALAILGVGAVFAQAETPTTGHGPMQNGEGPLHTFMVIEWAKKLDLNVNDINTRLAAGETMYDIALSAGVTAEEYPAVMTEVRAAAVEAGVAANVISQEQADGMLSHGQGMGGGGRHGNATGTGECDGTGTQSGSHGRGGMGGGHWQTTTP